MESRSDTDIQHQVESELFACPDVDETDIAVKVTDGTVTLSGYARTLASTSRPTSAMRSASCKRSPPTAWCALRTRE